MRTLPGENLQLFGDPEPAPSAAYAAFTAGAGQAAPTAASAAGDPSSSYERRERLRTERSRMVALRARATGEPHRAINARLNRATGVRSVGEASLEQLTRANELLARELTGER